MRCKGVSWIGLCSHIEHFRIDDSVVGCTIAKYEMESSVRICICVSVSYGGRVVKR